MHSITKALLVGYCVELLSIASAVCVGSVSIPHLHYGALLDVRGDVADSTYRVLHAGGICIAAIYHDSWHKLHPGDAGCPDPLGLFTIMVLIQGFIWSAIAFVYLRHKRGKTAEPVAPANAGRASG